MYIYNMNQSHGIHRTNNQVHAFHDLVNGVVRRLSPANHDRALTHGTVGDLTFESLDDKGNTLIHEIFQVRGTRAISAIIPI